MNSRQIAQLLWLVAGVSILLLLMIPVVHVPCVVVHGPTTELRAQRAAWLLNFLIRAAAFLFAGMLLPMLPERESPRGGVLLLTPYNDLSLNCALRC